MIWIFEKIKRYMSAVLHTRVIFHEDTEVQIFEARSLIGEKKM